MLDRLGPSLLHSDALLVGIKLHNITHIIPYFFYAAQPASPLFLTLSSWVSRKQIIQLGSTSSTNQQIISNWRQGYDLFCYVWYWSNNTLVWDAYPQSISFFFLRCSQFRSHYGALFWQTNRDALEFYNEQSILTKAVYLLKQKNVFDISKPQSSPYLSVGKLAKTLKNVRPNRSWLINSA